MILAAAAAAASIGDTNDRIANNGAGQEPSNVKEANLFAIQPLHSGREAKLTRLAR